MKDIISKSTEETEKIAEEFAKALVPGDFVAMYGTLGAGKTAFVRGMGRIISPDAKVHSPTYTVVNEYEGKDTTLCHFDMYRISGEDDLYSTGFYDYDDCIIVTEWSENISYALPKSYYKISIEKCEDENTRHILIERKA
ncbi:MAG: tRNA (adenosine(37)-N6)-threonylcarbamoyltransferase complex ATPase subunit type 1 TsaE [Ruminococcaceae bacterium]|nr:tRNA (adenosine(37)-N6)-threonylcarbamoyltransferase complex ATPase subunit type 1 TsaE [Oscillospiraceae bacterium]